MGRPYLCAWYVNRDAAARGSGGWRQVLGKYPDDITDESALNIGRGVIMKTTA